MALAFREIEIETELGGLDADLCRKSHCVDLIEEKQIMVADHDCGLGTGNRFAQLSKNQPTTARCYPGARLERVAHVLARHEGSRRPLHECAPQSEVVEAFAAGCREENRTSERHRAQYGPAAAIDITDADSTRGRAVPRIVGPAGWQGLPEMPG